MTVDNDALKRLNEQLSFIDDSLGDVFAAYDEFQLLSSSSAFLMLSVNRQLKQVWDDFRRIHSEFSKQLDA